MNCRGNRWIFRYPTPHVFNRLMRRRAPKKPTGSRPGFNVATPCNRWSSERKAELVRAFPSRDRGWLCQHRRGRSQLGAKWSAGGCVEDELPFAYGSSSQPRPLLILVGDPIFHLSIAPIRKTVNTCARVLIPSAVFVYKKSEII